jgi:hypothetical protein
VADSTSHNQTKPTIEKETLSPLGKDKAKSPEEQELDAEFQPIASTILELKKKIKGLEGTLARRKGHYGTDSLKIRLHECISEISSTLSEMGSIHSEAGADAAIIAAATNVSPNTSKIDILNWDKPDMRQNLSWIEEKRRELEAAALLAAQQASTVADAIKPQDAIAKQLSPRQDLEEAPQRSDETSRVAPQPVSDVASEDGSDSESDGDKSDSEEGKVRAPNSKTRHVFFPSFFHLHVRFCHFQTNFTVHFLPSNPDLCSLIRILIPLRKLLPLRPTKRVATMMTDSTPLLSRNNSWE